MMLLTPDIHGKAEATSLECSNGCQRGLALASHRLTASLPFLNVRSDVNLVREATLALHVQGPVRLRDIIRIDLGLFCQLGAVVLAPGNVDGAVNVGPRDMDTLGSELLGERYGECTLGKVGAGERGHLSVGLDAGRCTGEDQGWIELARSTSGFQQEREGLSGG